VYLLWYLELSQGSGRTRMIPRLRAQLRSSSGRSSKLIKDQARIETAVEVGAVGRLVLEVDGGGGYSLRAYPKCGEDPSRDLLAVGVVRAGGIVAIRPEASSAVDGKQAASTRRPERSPKV
jgi:hypothetical protein